MLVTTYQDFKIDHYVNYIEIIVKNDLSLSQSQFCFPLKKVNMLIVKRCQDGLREILKQNKDDFCLKSDSFCQKYQYFIDVIIDFKNLDT